MKKKSSAWIWVVAAMTAVVGAAVALAVFAKRTGKKLQKDLDFDDSIYFEDDEEETAEFETPVADESGSENKE